MDHHPPGSVPEPAKNSRFIRICACFKPLNVFVPPALLLIALGVVKGAIAYTQQHHLGGLAITMTLTGIQTLFIGLLADLIDQRMKL
jgi:hypothetical protein